MEPRGRGRDPVHRRDRERARRRRVSPPSPAPRTACARVAQVAGARTGAEGHPCRACRDRRRDRRRLHAPTRSRRRGAARARRKSSIPDEIARNYVWLHRQRRSAWTFELDLRPWSETLVRPHDEDAWNSCSISPARTPISPIARCRRSSQRTGAELVITPCLLGGLFKATGNQRAVRRLRRRQGQARLRDAGNPALCRAPRADKISR